LVQGFILPKGEHKDVIPLIVKGKNDAGFLKEEVGTKNCTSKS